MAAFEIIWQSKILAFIDGLRGTTYELLFNQSTEEFSSIIATDNTDLNEFKNNGGKLIILHGLTDNLIASQGTIEYYTLMQEYMGGRENTTDFIRLFLFPGLDHGFTGNAPKLVHQMDALVDWVEKEVAPNGISPELRNEKDVIIQTKVVLPY